MYVSGNTIVSGNVQHCTFQPGVFCKSLILRRTSPQSSLQESNMRINPNMSAVKYLLYWYTILMGEGGFSCQLMRYGSEHTSSSPSSFTSFQLRGVELTPSFEDDELLEPSVASDARGFLEARSRVVKVFAPESGETRDGSRVSDLRLGAIDENGCQRYSGYLSLISMLEICLFKLTRL
jgi:hypothetical protein